MIVTRAPFRISFAGGGTDLPAFYAQDRGAVLSTTINKYVYVMINRRSPLFNQGLDDEFRYRIRLSYSSTESVERPNQLKHPIVREALAFLHLDEAMDIATMADVPAGTGLGSSSTFTVALLHALHCFKGEFVEPEQLAAEAARLEIERLKRPIGKQDHYASAFGGMNMIEFLATGEVPMRRVAMSDHAQDQMLSSLLLLYTGIHRDANRVLLEQQANTVSAQVDLTTMRDHAYELEALFKDGFDASRFGRILHETWECKRTLASSISNPQINQWYDRGIAAGAFGGKLCGAGGGGFLLFVVSPQRRAVVREALRELREMDVDYEPNGSQILLHDAYENRVATI